jgi:serine/threonine protein kinase/KaiC/GvpD/RAD55 family RecA-like ATPase
VAEVGPRVDSGFSGGDRFVIQRKLGAGGMGVVYAAYDQERKGVVALKTLKKLEAATLYRFKNEFRALADLSHPNLIRLYELVSVADEWFFTMELVEGCNFREWIRPRAISPEDDTRRNAPMAEAPPVSERIELGSRRPISAALNLPRLHAAMQQLAQGVFALHQAGKLHRDIKPSNVLVDRNARVMLCDFGLVADVGPRREHQTAEKAITGTPAYMSPEQAAHLPLGEASDWYSVGVMLFEALTGQLPFPGLEAEVMAAKQVSEPPPPSELVDGVPSELDALCADLLRLRPDARPRGREILRRLGAQGAEPKAPPSLEKSLLIGRAPHVAALQDAFETVKAGGTATVLVRGVSGMGKTTLVRHFLDDLASHSNAVLLTGRCYERESVPYKALDSLIDALSGYLLRLAPAEAESLIPADVLALARLFPVLRRVEAVAEPPVRAFSVAPDPLELRRRAFGALRELLARVAVRDPVVLYLDDLQWGDFDSAALLADLLRPPDAPRVLLLASFRSEDAGTSPLLKVLLDREHPSGLRGDVRHLAVEALSPQEARSLALQLFGDRDPARLSAADAIANESGGSPYFVYELCGHVQRGATLGESITLDRVLETRFAQLAPQTRSLLEVVAVAGRPVMQAVVRHAAGLSPTDQSAFDALRSEHLVRSRGVREYDTIEPFHDRIRESMLRRLSEAELRATHKRLAQALRAVGQPDLEALVEHLLGSGESEQAGRHAEEAARQAAEALAFDRAARLYELALQLVTRDAAETRALTTRLGDALANAGRGADAAKAYLSAAEGAPRAEGLELRRRAAEQFLRSGHFEEGRAAISDVLGTIGLRLARTPGRALASLLVRRLRIKLRGLKYEARDIGELAPATLSRIDICWSVASGLSLIDTIRGADFQTRHLMLALNSGERYRIARGFAMEAAFNATGGGPRKKHTARLCETAKRTAEEIDNPHALGLATAVTGIAAFLQGNWRTAKEECARAEQIWIERGGLGVAWELASARFFMLGAMSYLGEIGALSRLVMQRLREAEQVGDLYAATGLRSWRSNIAWLAKNDAAEARRQVQEAMRLWSQKGFHLQHYYDLLAQGNIDLYTDDGPGAWSRVTERWKELSRSMLLRVQNVRIESWHLRARSAIATARVRDNNPQLLRVAEKDATRIEREQMPWATAIGQLVEAGVAAVRGQQEAAADALRRAITTLESAEMGMHAAAARMRLGGLIGGDEGRTLLDAARTWMEQQGIANPQQMTAMLVPGFSG